MYGKSLSTGTSGLIASPAFAPQALIIPMISFGSLPAWSAASRWKLIRFAPHLANLSMYLSGLMIIRWTSIGTVTALAIASITGNPNEMFGTRLPSITSMWIRSAFPLTILMSGSRLRKLPDSIEGAIFTIYSKFVTTSTRCSVNLSRDASSSFSPGACTPLRVGPKEIISRSPNFSPKSPHSSPA